MLTLTRKVGEDIFLDLRAVDPADLGAVRLLVVDIDRNRMRLAVAAGRSIPIYRGEEAPPEVVAAAPQPKPRS